jgi:hypothetical protein
LYAIQLCICYSLNTFGQSYSVNMAHDEDLRNAQMQVQC